MRQGSSATALREHEPPELTARLRVDQDDPFFFDHPLDHVPGMLLVCGAVGLVRAGAGGESGDRIRAAMTFRNICELDPAPEVRVSGGDRGRISVTQGPVTVADGWFEFSAADDVPATGSPAGSGPQAPASAVLVHRSRDENIMIGAPAQGDGHVTAAVLPPSDGHALAGRRPGAHAVEYLVEAGRQFSTWLPHRLGRWPLDAHMLWIGVTADLPMRLPRSLPVALRWQRAPIAGDKAKFHFDLIAADGSGPVLGSLRYASKMLGPDEYSRFRGDGGTER
ncbi:AfsA-related hotdog domain-containing protein [Actinoplanes sp. NPDC049668]|uniref:AfsA-related hotdog domain-containing protein n=1 Tax=unclassified Actinoplanes TaxID=2626549 RepID=UPI0033A150F3